MPLTSPRFAGSPRLQKAAENNPPLKKGETGEPVAAVQQALIDLGYAMPVTVKKNGTPDGIFGQETFNVVWNFQAKHGLGKDGVVGRNTLAKLDELLPGAAPSPGPLPTPTSGLPYHVPGIIDVIAQPTNMVCWATVATMMIGWKKAMCKDIGNTMSDVDASRTQAEVARFSYRKRYDNNKGMPPDEFLTFLAAANMRYGAQACYPIKTWLKMLQTHGLLWIGNLAGESANSGLHSRILRGMHGDGTENGTMMEIVDPAGGREYNESFMKFTFKYEQAFVDADSGKYYQIRHF